MNTRFWLIIEGAWCQRCLMFLPTIKDEVTKLANQKDSLPVQAQGLDRTYNLVCGDCKMSTNLYGVSTGKPSAKPKHSLRQLAKCNEMCAETNSHSTRRSNSATMKPSLTQDSLAQQASTRVPHHQPPSAWNHRSLRTLIVPGVTQEASTRIPHHYSHSAWNLHSLRTLIVPGVAQEASTRIPHHQPPSAWNLHSLRTLSAWGSTWGLHKSSPPLPTFSMKPSLTQDS